MPFEIWSGVMVTDRQILKDRATQLLIKYKSGALVTQFLLVLLTDAAGTILGSR